MRASSSASLVSRSAIAECSTVARQALHTPDHNDRTAATKPESFLTTRHEDDGQRSHAESTGCMDGLWVRCGHVQTGFPGMVDCKRANEPPRSPWVEVGLRRKSGS